MVSTYKHMMKRLTQYVLLQSTFTYRFRPPKATLRVCTVIKIECTDRNVVFKKNGVLSPRNLRTLSNE